jgi:hypothetical protein
MISKCIVVDNGYLQKYGSDEEDFSEIMARGIIDEVKNNPGLKTIGYDYRNMFYDETWYEDQFKKIAKKLDEELQDNHLEHVEMAYWPNDTQHSKIVWQRQ